MVTNAARNAPELLEAAAPGAAAVTKVSVPGSTRAPLPALSSSWQCSRYCGPTNTLAQCEGRLHRWREAGSKRGMVFLGNSEGTGLVKVSHCTHYPALSAALHK